MTKTHTTLNALSRAVHRSGAQLPFSHAHNTKQTAQIKQRMNDYQRPSSKSPLSTPTIKSKASLPSSLS
ncbi:hypothetical protein LguiA_009348 [Lonicera macranthoides]